MIETNNLTRCYGNFTSVDKVTFNIGAGKIVGLLGHNGAGKTTIMKKRSLLVINNLRQRVAYIK